MATSKQLLQLYFSSDLSDHEEEIDFFSRPNSGAMHDQCDSLTSIQERILVAYLSGLDFKAIRRRHNVPVWQIQEIVDYAMDKESAVFPDKEVVYDPAHRFITPTQSGKWKVSYYKDHETYHVGLFPSYEEALTAFKDFEMYQVR